MTDFNNPGPRGLEHHEPAPITSLDQFAALMVRWHGAHLKVLNHMLDVPEGVEVETPAEEEGGAPLKITLEGDNLLAFKIGLQTAIIEFTSLPFSVKAPEASNDEQPS